MYASVHLFWYSLEQLFSCRFEHLRSVPEPQTQSNHDVHPVSFKNQVDFIHGSPSYFSYLTFEIIKNDTVRIPKLFPPFTLLLRQLVLDNLGCHFQFSFLHFSRFFVAKAHFHNWLYSKNHVEKAFFIDMFCNYIPRKESHAFVKLSLRLKYAHLNTSMPILASGNLLDYTGIDFARKIRGRRCEARQDIGSYFTCVSFKCAVLRDWSKTCVSKKIVVLFCVWSFLVIERAKMLELSVRQFLGDSRS